MNGVESFARLRDVYSKLAEHRSGESFHEAMESNTVFSAELDYLLPDKWLERHPTERWEINEIRRKEREQTAESAANGSRKNAASRSKNTKQDALHRTLTPQRGRTVTVQESHCRRVV